MIFFLEWNLILFSFFLHLNYLLFKTRQKYFCSVFVCVSVIFDTIIVKYLVLNQF